MREVSSEIVQRQIYTVRGLQVMIDRDLAALYGVETRVLNQAVKRNIERFPSEFMFQMTSEELLYWMSQIVISKSESMGFRKLPFVFTEQGVSMLSAVLKSQTAIQTSIQIIKSFVTMRNFLQNNALLFTKIETIEKRQISYEIENNSKIEAILNAIEEKTTKPKHHIFYDGEIFDAYVFVNSIIKSATKSIKLLDNYIDENTLTLLTKRATSVVATIYTKTISKQLQLDIQKHNAQYPKIELVQFELSHDRFLIVDNIDVYHFGASIKDLGKKWFAASKLDIDSFELIGKLK